CGVVGGVYVFFFFQAEDGIRDWSVTGVQTCALPISSACVRACWRWWTAPWRADRDDPDRGLSPRSAARGRRHRSDPGRTRARPRSEEHTSELQSLTNLVCRLLLEKKKDERRSSAIRA